MLSEKNAQMQTHTEAHRERPWLLDTRRLTRYSSAMCDEYCCITSTQYAQHISLLISLTLSLPPVPSLFLSPSTPLFFFFSFFFYLPSPSTSFRHCLPLPVHSLPLSPCHRFLLDLSTHGLFSHLPSPKAPFTALFLLIYIHSW